MSPEEEIAAARTNFITLKERIEKRTAATNRLDRARLFLSGRVKMKRVTISIEDADDPKKDAGIGLHAADFPGLETRIKAVVAAYLAEMEEQAKNLL